MNSLINILFTCNVYNVALWLSPQPTLINLKIILQLHLVQSLLSELMADIYKETLSSGLNMEITLLII